MVSYFESSKLAFLQSPLSLYSHYIGLLFGWLAFDFYTLREDFEKKELNLPCVVVLDGLLGSSSGRDQPTPWIPRVQVPRRPSTWLR